ncbi:virginiamycin S resistance gene VarS related protein [Thermoplasma acidophilum]|uniref:Virginiamycin S resistance gene VarS related protein n=1 Tax=Thermoplasma acidophilum (strain ATCC 25905 / DSM 1728 / JCM 9062 / NBRC 15155 / AMRC-C165) TaxID=273075 RepID=Q9HL30_THEAC|nr:MFS transporter [Thermoplasma acidophilum]MCY0851287.1 MFS transporter [Thermoplasma acidophilum]CAC11552.1 virginiamycin S resistance gene VarS related protein [Thermoplasma acidophilum]
MVQYKWVALSNTTIGVLMASINGTIMMISLPAIFRGINLNPFLPSSFQYLLWILMGYMVVTAVLLVTVGRLSDMYGRVRLFNLGFAIFTAGSILLFLTPGHGTSAAMYMIMFRMVQAVGASFLFANSAAIITDAFPSNERGKAMGINQIAGLAGSLIGLILGGILATINWRYVFLVSVPVGALGTIWSYLKLKDQSVRRKDEKIDLPGNVTFAAGLTLILIGITYGLMPYGSSSMGWSSPWVISAMASGAAMLVAFPFIELHVDQPMFNMHLFKYRGFTFGNFAGFFQSMGMGGVMFMVIILLQGIWLPLHGYSYSSVPFWAGIYTIPMMAGFVLFGPIAGALSDRIGARLLTTLGMSVSAVAFILLTLFPYNFSYPPFAATLFMMGSGMGLFGAPNITAVMNSLPPHYRGTGSGMRATLQNTGQTASMGIFFSIVLITLTAYLSSSFNTALAAAGASVLIPVFDKIPATSALFSAFLGYNPMQTILGLLPASFASLISPSSLAILEGTHWFPLALAPAFMKALHASFYAGAGILVVAALLSAFRGKRFVYGEETELKEKMQQTTEAKLSSQLEVMRDGKK